MTDNLEPPDQLDLEIELRDLFKNGNIKDTARHSRIAYGTLTKMLNPNDTTESTVYEFLMLVYGAERAKPGLGEKIWELAARHRPKFVGRGSSTSKSEFEAAYHDFCAVYARREDGLRTDEELEAARERLAESLAGVGRKPSRVPSQAEVNRDVSQSAG